MSTAPYQIAQVVTNYLTNAVKYSASDKPVQVILRSEGKNARVSVQDHGPGLPPGQQAHVWEQYHRVPAIEIQSGTGVGLGLGLYLCRNIVLAHGGDVGVNGIPSQGSTFWFTLPLAPPPSRPPTRLGWTTWLDNREARNESKGSRARDNCSRWIENPCSIQGWIGSTIVLSRGPRSRMRRTRRNVLRPSAVVTSASKSPPPSAHTPTETPAFS
jgi:Histidine kinase-, DNA gyrase B-, and HSP90-like ATPase